MGNVDTRRFHVVQSVLDFFRKFPDRTPAAMAAVACLERVCTQVRVLLDELLLAQHEARSSIEKRDEILRRLRQGMGHLIRLAKVASAQEGAADLRFKVVFGVGSLGDYLLAARAALLTANKHRALLLAYGMPSELLEDLAGQLDCCEAAVECRAEAIATCTRVHADLRALTREAMRSADHLDALNHIRFANDPECLAEWEAAKRQATGERKQATTAGEGQQATGDTAGDRQQATGDKLQNSSLL